MLWCYVQCGWCQEQGDYGELVAANPMMLLMCLSVMPLLFTTSFYVLEIRLILLTGDLYFSLLLIVIL